MREELGRPLFEPDEPLGVTRISGREREEDVVRELASLSRLPAGQVLSILPTLKPETLVVAYRATIRRNLREVQHAIFRELHRRIAGFVHAKLSRWAWRDSEEREDVEVELARIVVAEWGTETRTTEFWEIRFWRCLRLRLNDAIRLVAKASHEVLGIEDLYDDILFAETGPDIDVIVLQVFLANLPPQLKLVVTLKFVYQQTDAEIARRLGVSERTVRNMIQRVRQLAAMSLEDA